jgi:hypothetical protein
MNPLDVSQLEQRIERVPWYRSFRNEYVIPTPEGTVHYIGEAKRVRCVWSKLTGSVTLARVDVINERRTKVRLSASWPWVQLKDGLVGREKLIYCIGTPYVSCTLVDRGEIMDYLQGMIPVASRKGLKLSDELFDNVFNPIDAQLLEYYAQIMGRIQK